MLSSAWQSPLGGAPVAEDVPAPGIGDERLRQRLVAAGPHVIEEDPLVVAVILVLFAAGYGQVMRPQVEQHVLSIPQADGKFEQSQLSARQALLRQPVGVDGPRR